MIEIEALEAILKRVKKPTRYLGGEWNSVIKDENGVELKVLLSRCGTDPRDCGDAHRIRKIIRIELKRERTVAAG